MTDEEQEALRATVRRTLLVEDPRPLGKSQLRPESNPPGIWLKIGGRAAYFGPNVKAAMFTAREGDWWHPERDGPITDEDVRWFDQRPRLGEDWKALQTRRQFAVGRSRIIQNYDYSEEPPLSQYELIRVEGQDGLWILDDSLNHLKRVELRIEDGFARFMLKGETLAEGAGLHTVAQLTLDENQEFVELEFFNADSEQPMIVLKRGDDGKVTVTDLKLG